MGQDLCCLSGSGRRLNGGIDFFGAYRLHEELWWPSASGGRLSNDADAFGRTPKLRGVKMQNDPSVCRPSWMTSNAPSNLEVEPQRWAMTVDQWVEVVDVCQGSDLWKVAQATPIPGSEVAKGHVNLYDINQHFVKPWTRGTGASIALHMNASHPLEASLMLSHSWAGDLIESKQALTCWCRLHELPRNTTVWFCLFANYQAGDEPGDIGPSVGEQLRLDPFGQVIKCVESRVGVVVLHTSRAEVYDRAWCVYEVDHAIQSNVRTFGAASCGYEHSRQFCQALGVETQNAKCSREDDLQMIHKEVFRKGGFDRINKVIRSFRLSMGLQIAVYKADVSSCRQLLECNADVNTKDVLGRTCLHLTAVNGDINTCKLLLEHGADPSLIDRDGNCPANITPLALPLDERDLALFELLTPTIEILCLKNSLGLAPYARLEAWARSIASQGACCSQSSFNLVQLRVEELQRDNPILREVLPDRKRASTSWSDSGADVKYSEEIYSFGERNIEVLLWQHLWGSDIDVLWWSGNPGIPKSLAVKGIDRVARHLCASRAAKVYCVMSEVLVDSSDMDLVEYLNLQTAIVTQLGLREPFILIDETRGMCTQLLWTLQSKLSGAVVMHLQAFFCEEALDSEHVQGMLRFLNNFNNVGAVSTDGKVETAVKMIMGFTHRGDEDEEKIERLAQSAVAAAEPAFWGYRHAWGTWMSKQVTSGARSKLEEMGPLVGLPGLLIIGSHSPALVFKESMKRWRNLLMPEAEIAELPNSNLLWCLEGNDQVKALSVLLGKFVSDIQTQGPCRSMTQCDGHDGKHMHANPFDIVRGRS